MSDPTPRELCEFLWKTEFNFQSLLPGCQYDVASRQYLDSHGKVATAAGMLEYVTHWNEFDEGNEVIFIVFSLNKTLFMAELLNDSWSGDNTGWELINLNNVEAKQVIKTVYERI